MALPPNPWKHSLRVARVIAILLIAHPMLTRPYVRWGGGPYDHWQVELLRANFVIAYAARAGSFHETYTQKRAPQRDLGWEWRWPSFASSASQTEVWVPLWVALALLLFSPPLLRLLSRVRTRPGRLRWPIWHRAMLWGCCGVFLACMAVWALSCWWHAEYDDGLQFYKLEPGALAIHRAPIPGPGWGLPLLGYWHTFEWNWPLPRTGPLGAWTELVLPFWSLSLAPLGGVFALVWWNRPVRRAGHCARCDYNLTGNISGVCPECGVLVRGGAAAPPHAVH